jgi:hypothetical protein
VFRALLAGLGLLAAVALAEELPVRDPMRPFVAGPAPASGARARPRFELTAVVLGVTRRVAVVNGTPYLLGESVDGATIVAIEPRAVRLDDGGRELVIPLGRSAEARPPTAEGDEVP